MIVIYALGGGWGHLTRSAALARVAPRPAVILSNSPYADQIRAAEPALAIEDMARDRVVRRIGELRPDTLVVDTFPRGLGGELAGPLSALPGRKVLVHRDLNPQYVEWAHLTEFAAEHFDLILIPGENEGPAMGGLPKAVVTAPWLVRDPGKIVPLFETDILICAGGNLEELAWYGEAAAQLAAFEGIVRCLAPERPPGCPPKLWMRHWPAMDLIAGAKVAIGGAGYNTVYECRALGVPLIAKAWSRQYDRQRRRALHSAFQCVETPAEAAAAAIAAWKRNVPRSIGPGGPPEQAASLLL